MPGWGSLHGLRGDPNVYILKGGSYRVVKDLSMDEKPQVFDLHPRSRGGEHYGTTGFGFFIIFQNQGEMRWVANLRTAKGERIVILHPKYTKGLYYFGIGDLLTLTSGGSVLLVQ
ncbi:hypothetical protein DR999_PMT20470 [Platysternon megacephalum]|uniref:Uncharacterized protein n=1 Tax=Platysternon megacephalum TaxID=55544 RepID=A0A4D9DS71_9SAUR|nr:hypothetical protein DR999_PMT20470 [Platysternon megacephalum]